MKIEAQFWAGLALGVVVTTAGGLIIQAERTHSSVPLTVSTTTPASSRLPSTSLAPPVSDSATADDFRSALALSVDGSRYDPEALAHAAVRIEGVGAYSRGDAVGAVLTFVQKGVAPAAINDMAFTVATVAKVAGRPLSSTADEVADGVSRGYEACRAVDNDFDFLTADQASSIRRDFDAGEATKARTECFEALHARALKAAAK